MKNNEAVRLVRGKTLEGILCYEYYTYYIKIKSPSHSFKMDNQNNLIPFEGDKIRKIWHNEDWYFSIVDIIEVLTSSPNPRNYWNVLKRKETELYTICVQLKLVATDGKQRLTDCANTEGVLRIVMSIPSPKAEPLKLWLAQKGKQAIVETENPELGFERFAEIYKAKGYSDEWIKNRLQSIETRKELTDEWKQRGVTEGMEYSILTATIAKETFGLNPSEHSEFKGLVRQNLRDHMTPLELIFTALSEEATRIMSIKDDAQGFNENLDAAYKGGSATGEARVNFEKRTGVQVVSSENFLGLKGGDTPPELPEDGKE
jgi:DNA-damage-inducible protein D